MEQNYPNPFNNETTINYRLPDGEIKGVLRVIEPATGRILLERKVSGEATGQVSLQLDKLASGMYFYQLEAGGSIIDTKKMIIIR